MKLATARKISAHATVLFAFGALALGGAMPAPAIAAFALSLPLAFAFEGRLKSESNWPTALLFALLLLLAALFLADALELAVAASIFAMALVLQRLFTRRRAADDGLLYLTALLMLTGGAALTAELLYAACFVGFALSATSALTLSLLSRQAEEMDAPAAAIDRLLSRRLAGALFGLSGVALLAALALFFVVPRMTAGAFARKAPLGGRSGFSDTIRLDTAGLIKDDPRPALRVRIDPDPGVETLDLHWRGAVFDFYDGREWQKVTPARAPARLPRPRIWVGPERAAQERLSVEVFPAASDAAVFVPERAVRLELLRAQPAGLRREMPPFFVADARGEVRLSRPAAGGYRYEIAVEAAQADAELTAPAPAGLRAILGAGDLWRTRAPGQAGASAHPPPDAAHLLALPEALDPRIPALARRLTGGQDSAMGQVRAIQAHLAGFAYSAEGDPGGGDPLAHFLFERRAGHCELFATAMAVMLRSLGVPARVVGGFYGGERTEAGDYLVRLSSAHAWVEVFVGAEAIAVVDPTPPEGRLSQASGLSIWLADRYERLSIHWQRLFVDLTFWDQWRALRAGAQKLSRGFERFQGRRPASAAGLSLGWLGLTLALLFSAVALAALVRFWRAAPVRAAQRAWHGDRLARDLYRHLAARLRRRGFVRQPRETEREFAARLAREGVPGMAIIHLVTERYLAARFGARPLERAEARRLGALVRSI